MNKSSNSDFLSQSYFQGIERITRTKSSAFNLQISEELLKVRKKIWDNLLDKYSKEMSDDKEINIYTLELEEDEENEKEKVVSEEEYSCEQRVYMPKPAIFIQYWINTGNSPYKILPYENELSEACSSLSEKEITSPLVSPVTNANKQECKNNSSCSSIDTAAYILSNANITKKVDTIAIIKGAKCVESLKKQDNQSLKEVAVKNGGFPSNDTKQHSMSIEYMMAEMDNKVANVSSNAIQSNTYSQSLSCEETDKTNEPNTIKKNFNVQTVDNIASVFRQFDKTSQQLIAHDTNNVSDLDQDKALVMDFHEKQVSEYAMHENITKNMNLTAPRRKKLYTNRNSPVDLILTETHSTNRLSRITQSLHPALDLDVTIRRESFSTCKDKNKRSFSAKRILDSKKLKGKEKGESGRISSEMITEISDINNVKLREIKIVLERLPFLPVKKYTSTMTEMQVLNKSNAAHWEKETTKKDNMKLREIRVVLERLPAYNICLKENSNVTNMNIFSNKKILQNTGLQTKHKQEPKIRKISQILACKNEVAIRPVRNSYSPKINTKFKKDTYDIVTQRGSQISDKIESQFKFQHKTFRRKDCSKESQNNRSKYSILTSTSSDEDDFVRSIQHPRKRSRVSTDDDDNISGKSNIAKKELYDQTKLIICDKDKYSYSRHLNTVTCSSENTVQRGIGSIRRKKEHDNTQTGITSLKLLRNKGKFVFSSSENDNSNVTDNSNTAEKKSSFFDSKKNTSNNNLKHSNGAIKKNRIDCKDNTHIMSFQTEIFNSSDSEESSSYTSSTCKVLTSSSIHNRCHDRVNLDEAFNDSIAKKYSKRHLGLSNSSLEKHNRTNDIRTKLKSIDKEAKMNNKRLANKKSNNDIKLRISDTRKDISFSPLINDIRVTSVQKPSNTLGIIEETNVSKNKEISEKSKNSVAIQQGDVTSTVRKLLTFQTKSYYDSSDSSDSNETM